jgi:hypothetical protein
MSQMTPTVFADNFDAMHPLTVVGNEFYMGFVDGVVKARPSASGIKLGIGPEKLLSTSGTDIGSIVLYVPIFASESRFGAF